MKFSWIPVLVLLAIPTSAPAQSQTGPISKPDRPATFAAEPFIVEKYLSSASFENDGTSEQDLLVRVRIQSDAGLDQWKELVFAYDAANETIDVRGVRILKSNGSTITIGPDSIKDSGASAASNFSAYANCKEKHISIASLTPGDTLEYEIAKHITKPPIAGQFWFEHRFVNSAVVLDERLQIKLPPNRKVILKSSPAFPYETETAARYKTLSWKHRNLEKATSNGDQSNATSGKTPDVQLTSFSSWAEVAAAYSRQMPEPRDLPAPIREKAKELVAGDSTDLEKARSIYEFASKNIHYVNLPLDSVGFAAHNPADTFSSGYATSLDMNALLVAMLHAADIPANLVLMPSTRRLDAFVPSPAQFDQALTFAAIGKDDVWMDPALGVAPFRLLPASLRKKSALVISTEGIGKIVETPADPPFLSTQEVTIKGRVSELGKLTARAHYALRGDTELALRVTFHQSPESQWKEIGQTILSLDGIHGEVSGVHSSDPTETRDPFQLDIDFSQSNFFDWSSKRASAAMPMLAIGLPDPPADKTKPIDLGSPLDVKVRLELTLPETFTARPPVALSLARDFADFKSNYSFAAHAITAERSLNFNLRQVAPDRAGEYSNFIRAVSNDQSQPVIIENPAPGGPEIPKDATADDLAEAGRGEFNAGNLPASIQLLERAVQLAPEHSQAWNDLGIAYLRAGKYEDAASALRKQLEINPKDEHANGYLGAALEYLQKNDEAAAAFRKQIEMIPLDASAHAALGELLLSEHDDATAATELEKATILAPKSAQFQVDLGRAYINAGANDKALAAFDHAVSLSPTATVWNEVALSLANHKLDLTKAQQCARSAVDSTERTLRNASLTHITPVQLNAVSNIARYWDTLGWVYAQSGELQKGLDYIRAAWKLGQNSEAGDHLAQIYEKLGQKDRAIEAYAQSLATPRWSPDSRARLTLLLGGNAQIPDIIAKAQPQIDAMSSFVLKGMEKEDVSADFWFLFANEGSGNSSRLETIQFVHGSESLRPFADELRSLDFGVKFPDAAAIRLIRRGSLSCSSQSGDCTLMLIPPDQVSPAN
jgi:tetratricopeptide (TPR) repeat protein